MRPLSIVNDNQLFIRKALNLIGQPDLALEYRLSLSGQFLYQAFDTARLVSAKSE